MTLLMTKPPAMTTAANPQPQSSPADSSDPISVDLRIGGMHCSACAVRIEKAVGRLPGVKQAAVSYASRSAWIVYEPSRLSVSDIGSVITRLGFQSSSEQRPAFDRQERTMLLIRLILSVILTIPLLLPMAHHIEALSFLPVPTILMNRWVQLGLATIIQLVPAAPFYYGAYYALKQRAANMDVLVATGTTAAYLYSHYMVFRGGGLPAGTDSALYFETSAVVITAVLLGKWIEAAAAGRTASELGSLGEHQPAMATVIREGQREQLASDQLKAGDEVIVGPGQSFPADGVLYSDTAETDESLLTGESRLVAKQRGDRVFAGTMNVRSEIRVYVKASGTSTALSRLHAMMREAMASKTSVQRKADAIAGIFVPVMIGLAAATYIVSILWWTRGDGEAAFIRALAVLLAACPCALGLATPLSLAAASTASAKRGIVLKQADALETAAQLQAVVFDKTGTLTEGRAQVTAVHADSMHPSALLRLAAAAEEHATHPYAAAVQAAAASAGYASGREQQTREQIKTANPRSEGGSSIELEGHKIAVGGYDYASKYGWIMMDSIRRFAAEHERKGETIWYTAVDNRCIGAIALADPLRADAREAIAMLRKSGIRHIVLASGDREPAAAAAASRIRINEVHASLRPEQKVALIQSLQRRYGAVAMVGDGWNDAPALAAADVGFAIGGGADAAMGAGQLALLHGRLTGVADTVRISRLTMRNVKQNLVLAFLYNMAVIPSAALGQLKPWMAGTAMALSSLSVVGNAIILRIQLRRRRR
ncbi:Cu+-exporting ATPase [Paenibacillus cellulosilyticus]|uniref:P-type Cu(+) transporter n=1 Tax=Paenibacillus cellulosilyticus TaxID=375489 RepID=A0A2V2YYJ8_9BACL|nr:cation-translocating P-type ATPase [Paenibacillus cellulosilyticus]PWW06496.1 Cu+-exporting ATPase [Paenibacillus cellulosilyticus]QKS46165.1 cation-translocating P-type ATPase [Paenibacillus cellulosilyticus]